jgi:hypothetical protein
MLNREASQSPYEGLAPELWQSKTRELVAAHPLSPDEIIEVVLKAWSDIFASHIGTKPFRIGTDILPSPQIMAFLLHELIPLELSDRYPGIWRADERADEKDLVYISDDLYSAEIKASSSARSIFGNRSYAQIGRTSKKSKAGYYLAINFEKFGSSAAAPKISKIRFGWLDHADWLGQQAATGQQARLSKDAGRHKMLVLYE